MHPRGVYPHDRATDRGSSRRTAEPRYELSPSEADRHMTSPAFLRKSLGTSEHFKSLILAKTRANLAMVARASCLTVEKRANALLALLRHHGSNPPMPLPGAKRSCHKHRLRSEPDPERKPTC